MKSERARNRCDDPPWPDPSEGLKGSRSAPEKLRRVAGILEAITEGVVIANLSGAVSWLNPAALSLFGFSSVEDALRNLPAWSERLAVYHSDGRPIDSHEWPINRAVDGGEFNGLELFIRDRRSGASWLGSFSARIARDANGRRNSIILTVADVTSKVRLEQALHESEQNFREITDAFPFMMWVSGADKLRAFVNRSWIDFRGRPAEQELGYGWREGIHPDDVGHRIKLYDSAFLERRPFTIEYRLRRHDGEYRWVLDQGNPRYSAAGTFLGYVGTCVDVTDERIAREEAVARQKLETLGVLAGGIAHDFNNLLSGIYSEAELAVADPRSATEEIQNIKKIALRGSEIVRELMIYAGQETATLEVLDLAELMSEMIELIRLSVPRHIRIETEFERDLPSIHANSAQIRQVIMNLVINGLEAIGDTEGKIRLATRRSGEFVQLQVSDTGRGMDAETQLRMFDPFFTTKYAGRGLGLAIVQAVVRNHGGTIDIESMPGQGATFSLTFPEVVAPPLPAPQPETGGRPTSPKKVHGAVLLVEDEPTVLLSVSRMLRRRGFSTLEAADGEAAIGHLADQTKSIGVMLLDMTIPGKSSREVFTAARRFRPYIKILLTTAYSREVAENSMNWPNVDGFLRKPYNIESLIHLIGAPKGSV